MIVIATFKFRHVTSNIVTYLAHFNFKRPDFLNPNQLFFRNKRLFGDFQRKAIQFRYGCDDNTIFFRILSRSNFALAVLVTKIAATCEMSISVSKIRE